MTTIDNKELMRRAFAGLAERDGDLFFASLADEVTWTNIGSNAWSRTFRGKESVLYDLLRPLRTRLAARPCTVAERFIADGDFVVVEARGDNVTAEGARYDNEYCMVFRLSGGRIQEIKEYSDTALVVSALGDLPPRQPAPRAVLPAKAAVL